MAGVPPWHDPRARAPRPPQNGQQLGDAVRRLLRADNGLCWLWSAHPVVQRGYENFAPRLVRSVHWARRHVVQLLTYRGQDHAALVRACMH